MKTSDFDRRLREITPALKSAFRSVAHGVANDLSPGAVDEAFQDFVFQKFFEQASKKSGQKFRTLVDNGDLAATSRGAWRVVRAAMENFLKSRHRAQVTRTKHLDPKEDDVYRLSRETGAADGPERESAERIDALARETIARLGPEKRLLLAYRVWEDETLATMAARMGLAVATVHERYQAVIKDLRKMLGAFDLDEPEQRRLVCRVVELCASADQREEARR